MEVVEEFDEKSYNNNGKLGKSSRILRVKPHFFIFLYFHHFSLSFFFIFSFFRFFHFFIFLFPFLHFFISPTPLPPSFHVYSFIFLFFHLSFFHFFKFFLPFYYFFMFFHFVQFFTFYFSFFSYMMLQAFVLGFNKRCFLRCRCSMEMWCPDDIRRDRWGWVGPPAWERA